MIRIKEWPETRVDKWVSARLEAKSQFSKRERATRRQRPRYEARDSDRLVSYMPMEDWVSRHRRRLEYNVANIQHVDRWAKNNGIDFFTREEGTKWYFRINGNKAFYSPSHATLKIGPFDFHVHDYRKVIETLSQAWRIED